MILISFKHFIKLAWKYMCKIPLDVYIVAILIIALIIAIVSLNGFYKKIQYIVMNFIGADKQRIQLFTKSLINDYEQAYNDEINKLASDDEVSSIEYEKVEKLDW